MGDTIAVVSGPLTTGTVLETFTRAGSRRWTHLAAGQLAAPAVTQSEIITVESNTGGSVVESRGVATGAVRWSTPLPGWLGVAPVITGDRIFVGNAIQALVYALAPDSGRIVATFDLGDFLRQRYPGVGFPSAFTQHNGFILNEVVPELVGIEVAVPRLTPAVR